MGFPGRGWEKVLWGEVGVSDRGGEEEAVTSQQEDVGGLDNTTPSEGEAGQCRKGVEGSQSQRDSELMSCLVSKQERSWDGS